MYVLVSNTNPLFNGIPQNGPSPVFCGPDQTNVIVFDDVSTTCTFKGLVGGTAASVFASADVGLNGLTPFRLLQSHER